MTFDDKTMPELPISSQDGSRTCDFMGRLYEYTRADMHEYALPLIERIVELEQQVKNLEYARQMRDDHRAELEQQNAALRGELEKYKVTLDYAIDAALASSQGQQKPAEWDNVDTYGPSA